MAVMTSAKTGGDVLLHRESLQKNMVSGTLKFPSTGGPHNLPQVAGYPAVYNATTKVLSLVKAGAGGGIGEADTNCVLVHGLPKSGVANNGTTPKHSLYSALRNGDGAVVNTIAAPTLDTAGGTLNWTTIRTALANLGFKVVPEPTKKTTQAS